ncbi:MAG: DUF998 domain-containing protein [Chloroflexi bacterium]|nr:DUF998 domain-containing protein [Chloroflexota bacterium]
MLDIRANNGTMLRNLAICGIGGPIIFAVFVTVNGFIYEGYSHATQAVSELGGANAEYPWLQSINFFIIGLAFIALAVGLHKGIGGGRGSIKGPALIFVFGASAGVANGIFPCDSGCDGGTAMGFMHNLTGLTGFVAAIVSVFVIARRLNEDSEWRSLYPLAKIFRFAVLLSFLVWIGAAKIADIEEVNGIFQRIYIGVWLIWAEILAFKLFSLSRASTG